MKRLIPVIACAFCAISLNAATIHVPADQPTIQAGIDSASNGDTVLVAPGTYSENVLINGKSIVTRSILGADSTIIQPADSTVELVAIVNGVSSQAKFEGFTLRFSGEDQALQIIDSEPEISHNIFYKNRDGYLSGFATLYTEYNGSAHIHHNLFDDNGGVANVYINSSAHFHNNTIVNSQRAGVVVYHDGAVIKNNIVVGCPYYGIVDGDYTPTIDYNNFFLNNPDYLSTDPGEHDISADPLFIDYPTGDFNLQEGSPCIDAGDPDPQYQDPDGTRNDMGAFPFLQDNQPPVLDSIGFYEVFEGGHLEFVVTASDPDGDSLVLSAENLPENAAFADSGNGHGLFVFDPDFTQSGVHLVTFIASDGTLVDSEEVFITVYDGDPLVQSVQIDGQDVPQHVVEHEPAIEWDYVDPTGEYPQTQFEIAVGTDTDWVYAEMWNPAPFETSDTFIVYAGTALADGETYYLRLRVNNGSIWSDWHETSLRMNSVPSVPIPLQPSGGEYAGDLPILWVLNSMDAEGDPLTYDFSGVHDTDCVAPAIELTDVPETPDSTGGQVIEPLGESCIYWWRARAFDGYEYTDWSPSATFIVNATPEPPTPPEAQYPPDTGNMPIFDMLTYFYWTPSTDPDPLDTVRYKLEISVDSAFNFVYTVDSIASTPFTLTDSLQFGTHYWWRVTAFDNTGMSAMSLNTRDFWTWTLGDLDYSHDVNIADLVFLVDFLFRGCIPPWPLFVADIDGDCSVNVADVTYLVYYLFRGGPAPKVGCASR